MAGDQPVGIVPGGEIAEDLAEVLLAHALDQLALGPEHLSCYELEAKPGTRFTPFIQNIDYAPTILDIAGAAIPRSMQGRSLRPLCYLSFLSRRWKIEP